MVDIILAVIALGLLVTVHETGHFIAARLCGVKVETFSIGFGKPILKFVRREIEYRIGWLPLGGYVRMKGESPEEKAAEEPGGFQFSPWWKKVIIAVSGPVSNLLLAILIFIFTFMLPSKVEDLRPVVGYSSEEYANQFIPGDSIMNVNGKAVHGWYDLIGTLDTDAENRIELDRAGQTLTVDLVKPDLEDFAEKVQPTVSTIIGDVSPGMSAWKAGLQPGDRIIKVDTTYVNDWYKMREMILNSKEDSVYLTLRRGNEQFSKPLELEQNPLSEGQRIIGITQYMPVKYMQSYPPLESIKYGFNATLNFVAINYVGIYKIISQPETIKSSVGGPVMIYSLSSQSAKKGVSSWLMFVAAISLVLMIMNLLPIPVLDGGHIMFALVQGVMGKPVPAKVQVILQNIGFVLLLFLMIYAFYNDFTKVFTRAVSTMGKP